MSYSADKTWLGWMNATSDVHRRYFDAMEEDDPFAYNERASVGILVAGAERAGLISLAEFVTQKGDTASATGSLRHRCDLYLYDEGAECEWGFEFKQAWYGVSDIYAKLDAARKDASVLSEECGTPCFGVIASFDGYTADERREMLDELHRDLKRSELFLYEFGESYNPGCAIAILGEYDPTL